MTQKRLVGSGRGVVVCWLLNVPATCECISGTEWRRKGDTDANTQNTYMKLNKIV